ncbi:unnamed protein product [Spirodela intermedia]|uniref:protein-serine/threonine phosphatase n=1 Tax=Spirodela intermedia TaxID=51605 RepID=A0A7I8J5T6_SPIIN|nr:unnamed protein product [Spirodela intermedia]CAA6665451.1 unnamed protein product [Spirodela intermedia]
MNNWSHPKRESISDSEDSTGKKLKVTSSVTENAEKVESSKTCASQEINSSIGKNDNGRFDSEVTSNQESGERILAKGIPSSNLGAASQCVSKVFPIEASAAEDKGSRHSMEDAWVVLPDASMECPGTLRCAHFAIYDGHGGRLAADYAQKHLHANVLSAGLPRELMDVRASKKAILEGFQKTDERLLRESAAGGWQDGATAVCLWVLGQMVLVANIGDAKAVLARSSRADGPDDAPLKAIVITREHKAIFPNERARIQKGRLEVSRAFGDRQFKKVGVTATPDIHSFELTGREKFIILGCDGLWGVFGPSDAVDFVYRHLQDGLPAAAVAKRLVREAVRERRCKDNCTVIVIVFKDK